MQELDVPQWKAPRTYHLPWTESFTSDDKILSNKVVEEHFMTQEDSYVTLKMDGENTTIGRGFSHARSLTSSHHWSREHIKRLEASLRPYINPGWRICGENVLATHSIKYTNLSAFFYVFAIYDEHNVRLGLDEMLEYCDYLGVEFVPILARAPFKQLDFKSKFGLDYSKDEGYVVSNAAPFAYDDFSKNVAKCVRPNHVQTDEHWTKLGSSNKNQLSGI